MPTRTLPDFFAHTYPRYGLAAALVDQDVLDWKDALADTDRLLGIARRTLQNALHRYRVHTNSDLEDATTLTYRYLAADEVEPSGQKAEDGYYIMPHVVIDDQSARYSVKGVRSITKKIDAGISPSKSAELKRSFTPFTTKLNQGTQSQSNPKTDTLEVIFSMVAAVTPLKPATQVDFTNQAMIPDLDLEGLITFVRLFQGMHRKTGNGLTLTRKEGSNRKRPPIFDGNYPDAPRSPAFGPIGLMGAIGQWMKRADVLADEQKEARETLDAMKGRSIYLVSYDGNLMRQEHIGHHVARLAANHNLPKIIRGLYRIQFYNAEHNKPDSNTRANFFMMASRFLQLHTKPSFKDFLAFRANYNAELLPILESFFMNEYKIEPAIVKSARVYGAYLNDVAYYAAREEVDENEARDDGGTGRGLYDAKTRVLAQLESTAMSARRPSSLFSRINVMAGRMSGRDVPAKAERFLEAAQTGEIPFDEAKDLVLAYMRLRKDQTETSNAKGSDTPTDKASEPSDSGSPSSGKKTRSANEGQSMSFFD